jgi:putative membrane fusion protein
MDEKLDQKTNDKEESKVSRIKIGSFIIIVFILLYVPSFIHWIYGENISTDLVRIGEVEDSINSQGVIVRNEEVIESPFEGNCITDVGEGEKVAVNSSIATVLKNDSDSLLDAIKKKDMEIIKAQQERNKNSEVFLEDIAKLEKEISEKVKLVTEESNKNNLLEVGQLKEDIDELIQKKATISGDTGSADSYITSLKKEKESLQQKIQMNTRQIVSKSSGVVSYVTDGYESILNSGAIKDITPSVLEGIKDSKSVSIVGSRPVEAGKPFAKVIKDLDYYVLVALNQVNADRFTEGDYLDFRLNEVSRTVSGQIVFKSKKIEGKYVIALKSDEGLSEISGMRKVNVDLIKKHYKGYRVPLNSLINLDVKNQRAKIVLVKSNYASIRDVKIKGTDGEFAIVTNFDDKAKNGIGLYDIYVCKPGNIQEGQMIIK